MNELLRLEAAEAWVERITLSSGNVCAVKLAARRQCEHHYVLYFPSCQGAPTLEEREEMLLLTLRRARQFAEQLLGNPEAYHLSHNGLASVSWPDIHYHFMIVADAAARREALARGLAAQT